MVHSSLSLVVFGQKARPNNNMNPAGPDQFQDLSDSVLSTPGFNSSPETYTSQSTSSAPIYVSSPTVNPAPCSGSAEDCNGFLLQYSLALEMQLYGFPMENLYRSVLFLLSGRALQWAETTGQQTGLVTQSLSSLVTRFLKVFHTTCFGFFRK